MKKEYVNPVIQEESADVTFDILVGSNIGQGEDGQDGDVKESDWWHIWGED